MHATDILVGIAFLTATANVDAIADMGLKEKFWKPMCDLSEELDMHPQDATRVLTSGLKAIKNMKVAALQAEIYSKINYGQQTGTSAAIMAGYFDIKTAVAVELLQDTGLQKEVTAAATTAYLKGRIDKWLQFMNGMKTEGTRRCLLDENGDNPAKNAPGQIGGHA
uniref:Variant surface glycoprotein n=1 Tax=Trypanosoma brucei TaxID=5691 RepID=A0A1V0FZC1_9TRYP|nr:variant surface glycoprotein [Trypanosoma brucei]